MVDDLKPVLGAYGDPAAFTPNMDMLAEKETADRGKKMCKEYVGLVYYISMSYMYVMLNVDGICNLVLVQFIFIE